MEGAMKADVKGSSAWRRLLPTAAVLVSTAIGCGEFTGATRTDYGYIR
jgi:hypothetical protein